MGVIEILATIFAIVLLVKLFVISIKPKAWADFAISVFKGKTATTIVYLLLAIIVGYYLLEELTIVQIAATTLFVTLLIGASFMPFSAMLIKLEKDLLKKGSHPLRKFWFPALIWLVLALWTLYVLFL